jgi:hypothetical protein
MGFMEPSSAAVGPATYDAMAPKKQTINRCRIVKSAIKVGAVDIGPNLSYIVEKQS